MMCSINVYIQLYELVGGNAILKYSLALTFLQRSDFYQHSLERGNYQVCFSCGLRQDDISLFPLLSLALLQEFDSFVNAGRLNFVCGAIGLFPS